MTNGAERLPRSLPFEFVLPYILIKTNTQINRSIVSGLFARLLVEFFTDETSSEFSIRTYALSSQEVTTLGQKFYSYSFVAISHFYSITSIYTTRCWFIINRRITNAVNKRSFLKLRIKTEKYVIHIMTNNR